MFALGYRLTGSIAAAFIGGPVALECGKNRYRAPADVRTHFDTTTQTFTPAPSGLTGFDDAVPATARGGQPKRG